MSALIRALITRTCTQRDCSGSSASRRAWSRRSRAARGPLRRGEGRGAYGYALAAVSVPLFWLGEGALWALCAAAVANTAYVVAGFACGALASALAGSAFTPLGLDGRVRGRRPVAGAQVGDDRDTGPWGGRGARGVRAA